MASAGPVARRRAALASSSPWTQIAVGRRHAFSGLMGLSLGAWGCGPAAPEAPKAMDSAADAARSVAGTAPPAAAGPDPLAVARAAGDDVGNVEAQIPAQCYTATDGRSNPCWACHTKAVAPNATVDWDLQVEYEFSSFGKTNRWANLDRDLGPAVASTDDAAILAWVRSDNYGPLRERLAGRADELAYAPDLDLHGGFDAAGFARDGSGWRAFRYKPFVGTFWPTNGATDDVMIRLPAEFRTATDGTPSDLVYRANLAILEAAIGADPELPAAELRWPIEPLDERALGVDLDGDGVQSERATWLVGLPAQFLGRAAAVAVRRGLYPLDTEFLHSVRYLDPDAPDMIATRLKELRYARKFESLDDAQLRERYAALVADEDAEIPPSYGGDAFEGLTNDFGWRFLGFIEDADGELRLQTREEQRFCMGCHSGLSVTVDQTFSFARKLPGAEGWAYQSLAGMPDVPQLGHTQPETLVYFERVGAGDEYRANAELLARFFGPEGVKPAELLRAAVGGDRDLAHVVAPSRERALLLNKAYRALVLQQDPGRGLADGRDAFASPPPHVHRTIAAPGTGLDKVGRVYVDGQLRLDWSGAVPGLRASRRARGAS